MGMFSFDSVRGFLSSINFNKRQKKIANVLKEENADIITLQEVHTYSFLNILKKTLKDYPYVGYKRFIYGPRGGLVTFSKFHLENIDYINFKERGTFLNTSFIARVIRNGVLACRLKGLPVYILNAHTTPNLDHNYIKNNRFIKFTNAQLKQIAEVVKELSESNTHIILAGDFNVAKNAVSYKNFLRASGTEDIFKDHELPTQHQEYLPSKKKVKRIDFIFLKSPHAKIKAVEHIFTKKYYISNKRYVYLSDHIGLRADITI